MAVILEVKHSIPAFGHKSIATSIRQGECENHKNPSLPSYSHAAVLLCVHLLQNFPLMSAICDTLS